MKLPDRVTVTEVGPRDGLQNERRTIPLEQRVALIDALSATGLTRIEAASFVKPEAIAETYWHLAHQDRSAWTMELEVRPFTEKF